MKKQNNPDIKAHFVRTILIVLSFVAVCVIPFALAQRANSVRPFESRYGSSTPESAVNPADVAGKAEALPAVTPSCTPEINEGFDDIVLPGWVMINHSAPVGLTGWFQDTMPPFNAFDGAPDAFIAANFNNTAGLGTISNWLLTPQVNLRSGSTLTFYTRTETPAGAVFPDRLQVRMSTNGSSTNVGTGALDVGDFTTLLLDINPDYTATGYPETWTQFTVNITGTAPGTLGRLAFRYFVENGGPDGTRSDYIGIDRAVYTPSCATPTPTATATATASATPGTPTPSPTAGPTGRFNPTPRPRFTPVPRPTP
jgi:hypothetical protein